MGADFINTARGFVFSLSCIQALRCHTNVSHRRHHAQPEAAARSWSESGGARANYASGMNRDIEMIAHSCGVEHPRLKREHCRIVRANGHRLR